MILTSDDIQQIRNIFQAAVGALQDEVVALRNDLKEIYDRLGRLEHRMTKLRITYCRQASWRYFAQLDFSSELVERR